MFRPPDTWMRAPSSLGIKFFRPSFADVSYVFSPLGLSSWPFTLVLLSKKSTALLPRRLSPVAPLLSFLTWTPGGLSFLRYIGHKDYIRGSLTVLLSGIAVVRSYGLKVYFFTTALPPSK
ncbi:hypothetical protein B0H19DRAFT_1106384 [Mycena capillaripes]|nr:hypothetical protein B0H19DRAFT_1106384 [Mycena capillaripes]